MKLTRTVLRRPMALVSALAILVGAVAPALLTVEANAAQVTGRSISLSDSTPGATGTIYALTMTMPSAAQSMVIDFCTESPIISGTCTAPTGMDAATSGAYTSTNPGTNTPPGSSGPGSAATGFAVGTLAASRLKITSATATTAGTKYTFYFTGIKNPTTTGTFYARVYTYANATYGATPYSSPTAPGTYADYGGFALSTAANVTITATVMETLAFCVSKAAPTAGCTGTSTPALTIGHGSPLALDTTAVDTDTAYTQLSTNAQSGAIVNLKTTSSTTCAGLSRDSGATCSIAAIGATGAIATGSGLFGVIVADGTGGTGTVTHNSNYATATNYTMRPAVFSTYGDSIEASTAACANVNSLLTYGASAAATTPAGVYSTTESLIATGTF